MTPSANVGPSRARGRTAASDSDAMDAMVLSEYGPADVLHLRRLPIPTPGPREVRVKVRASFVAYGRDVNVRSGRHPIFPKLITLPHVLGGEHAGVVDALGEGVEPGLLGARVAVAAPVACHKCAACLAGEPWDCADQTAIGIQRKGSNADYTVVPRDNVELIPAASSFEEAAALAASGPLAWEELEMAAVGPGSWVLVPGAAGSVGNLVVALAKRRGANVVAATRGRRAAEELLALGADAVVDAGSESLSTDLAAIAPGGVSAVIDNVMDPDLWNRYWPAVARRGRIVTAGQAGKPGATLPIDVVSFYNRRATFTGVTIGDPRPIAAFWAEMRRDPIRVLSTSMALFELADAAAAHRRIENGHKFGHVVLVV